MRIREAVSEDRDFWLQVAAEVADSWQAPDMPWDPAFHAFIGRKIEQNEALVAEDPVTGEAMGVISYSRANRRISWFGVLSRFRGRGAGSAVLEEALARLGVIEDVSVVTFREGCVSGAPALRMYRRFGFEVVDDTIDDGAGHPRCLLIRSAGVAGPKPAVPARIAVVGEFDPKKKTHLLLNLNLDWLRETNAFTYEWVETTTAAAGCDAALAGFDGVWSAPGTPFASLDGALAAIRHARENRIPLLGTCGGFQHVILEHARNVLGYPQAQHEEYDPDADCLFISRLSCSLAGRNMQVAIQNGTLAGKCYGKSQAEEDYYCSFGINPVFGKVLEESELRISGTDQDGESRILELQEHPFFLATLFVPQSKSERACIHPILTAFVKAAVRHAQARGT